MVDGVEVDQTMILVRRSKLKEVLRLRPELASYRQSYEPQFNVVILLENPLASGQLIVNPTYAADARRHQSAWEALLDETIEVTSPEGMG